MGSKTRLGSYCTKRANNGVNLVTSRNINTRLARPIAVSDRQFVTDSCGKSSITFSDWHEKIKEGQIQTPFTCQSS